MGIRALRLLALFLAAPTVGVADDWGGSLALTSNYMLRGISLSDGLPAIQGDLHYRADRGWFVGAWASSVKLNHDDEKAGEIDWFAGFSGPLTADWSGKVELVRYSYPINRQRDGYDYTEIIAGLSFRDTLTLDVAYSPDYSRYSYYGLAEHLNAYSADIGWRQPLVGALSLGLGLGFYRLDDPARTQYAYWNAGFSYPYKSLRLDVTYIGAGHQARSLFYSPPAYNEAATRHWSATLLWQF